MKIGYKGKVRGFLGYALPELRKCAMRGWRIETHQFEIQNALRKAQVRNYGPRNAA
ncbi:MAG TPA: hypothetical protein GXX19_02015 [Syntrophomonadaceae bacterium]|nr:hypothetical protein [Syntrophomonadaceae bacterium]